MGENEIAAFFRRDLRLAGCPKWGRRPFYLGRYKDKYSVDCRGVDTRYGESTGMVEFTAGNGKELYGSTRDDEEYRSRQNLVEAD